MKTSIIYLGVFALTVFTSCNAKNGLKIELFNQQEISSLYMGNNEESNFATLEKSQKGMLENALVTEKDSAVFEAITAYKSTYVKSIEEVIAEDNLITENYDEEFFPLPLNNKILKTIAEDNKIIESTNSEEVRPLDFKLINATSNKTNTVELDIINFDKNALKS